MSKYDHEHSFGEWADSQRSVPAEPDSGTQEQKVSDADSCLPSEVDPQTLGKPDAPADNVSAVLQNALKEALPILEIVRDYEPGEPDGACAPNRARILCEQIETLLSEHRSGSPATSVSAKPDSAPWTVEEDTKWIGSYVVDGNGKRIAYSQLKTNNEAIRDAHNATLSFHRSGSVASGEHTVRQLLEAAVQMGEINLSEGDINYLCDILPTPSSPSSAEQKGT